MRGGGGGASSILGKFGWFRGAKYFGLAWCCLLLLPTTRGARLSLAAAVCLTQPLHHVWATCSRLARELKANSKSHHTTHIEAHTSVKGS
eukprot:3572702-Amphidinium_carterae.1